MISSFAPFLKFLNFLNMNSFRKKAFIAILAGMGVGFIVVMFVETMGSFMAPPPKGLDFYNKDLVTAYMQSAPLSMYLLLLTGYGLGAFAGGWVTNLQARGSGYRPALITGVGLMVMGILNLLTLWHPAWFWWVSVPAYLVFAWLGGQRVLRH